MNPQSLSLFLLRLALSFIWLSAGLSKLFDRQFINNFPNTIGNFAKASHFYFYTDFLNQYVIPNSEVFAQLSVWGEILTGVAFLIGFPMVLGALVGIFLNLNYFLIATQPPSQFLNILMIFSQLVAYTNDAGCTWGMCSFIKKK